MRIVAVMHEVVEVFVEYADVHLAVALLGQRDDFVLGELHGAGFVDVDMARVDTDDALVLVEHRVDGGGVGLGAARQEEHLGVGQSAGLADALLGTLGELVEAIGGGSGVIPPHEVLHHLGMGTIVVVAFEGYHLSLRFSFLAFFSICRSSRWGSQLPKTLLTS